MPLNRHGMPTDIRTIFVTAPDTATGELLGRALVEERLAACANIVPGVVSLYRWKGETHRDAEVLMIVKTTRERADAVRARVVELHPYDVPEVVVLAVEAGHEPYLDWVRAEAAGS